MILEEQGERLHEETIPIKAAEIQTERKTRVIKMSGISGPLTPSCVKPKDKDVKKSGNEPNIPTIKHTSPAIPTAIVIIGIHHKIM